MGDLYHLLHDASKQLPMPLKVRIALDTAMGMRFLHSLRPPVRLLPFPFLSLLLPFSSLPTRR